MTKRIFALGAALFLALGLAACGGAEQETAGIPRVESGDNAVVDEADVLSQDTENYVTNLSVALQESCGAQIGVYTVEYIGNTTMEGYAYEIANGWGLGDAEKDNGILLLLATKEVAGNGLTGDYYITRGEGLESQLSIATLSRLLDQQMEPSWLKEDYDTGTRATVRALTEQVCQFYGLSMDIDAVATGQNIAASAQMPEEGDGGFWTFVLVLVAILLVIWLIGTLSRTRRPRQTPPPPPAGYSGYGGYSAPPRRRSSFGSGFASGLGFGVGQSVGRRMFGGGRRTPPPPGGPGMGGFSAPPRSAPPSPPRSTPSAPPRSTPSAPPRSGGSFGGMGRSGGIGRSGGSFRAGGGSFRGGGAERRR